MSDAARCDQCGAFAQRPPRSGSYSLASALPLPEGWIGVATFTKPPDEQFDERGEFCRRECAAKWVAGTTS